MRALDRYLRDVRIAKARSFVREGDVVVDVGCADGAMFEQWAGHIEYGHGVDPVLDGKVETSTFTLHGGHFPQALPKVEADVITMLAVIEHIPPEGQAGLADACAELLVPGGRVVVTVPSPRVDDILEILRRGRLVDGMSLEEHYGFDQGMTPSLFPPPIFKKIHQSRFQLGLNNLYVFEKTGAV